MFPSEISFSTPEWLVNFYHVTTVCSFFINVLGIYLIMFQSGKIDNFKHFLLWFTVCCLFVDFFFFFLMQPIPLTPIWAGYINGPFRSVFGFSCHTSATICGFVIGQQFAALTMCFVRKYQGISKIDVTDSVSDGVLIALSVSLQVLIVVWLFLYLFTSVSRQEAFEIINRDYPEYTLRFLQLEEFAFYVLDEITLCCIIMAGFCAAVFSIIIVFSTVQMFKLLSTLEQRVSLSNLKRHRNAVSSLLAQFLASAVAIIPPVGCGFLLFLEFRHVQVSIWIMLAVSSCHGVLNCLVMILTFPPYRNYVKNALWFRNDKQPSNWKHPK